MAKFVFYSSLKPAAKRAFNLGNGKHGRFAVDNGYIAELGSDGRAKEFVLVVRGKGKPVKAITKEEFFI